MKGQLVVAVLSTVLAVCSLAHAADESLAIGIAHFEAGEIDAAIGSLEKATEKNPSDSDSQMWLGRAYLAKLEAASMFRKLGLSKKVRACYLKAIELNPDNLSARESLAGYYFEAPGIAGGSTENGMEQVRAIKARDVRRGHIMLASHYIYKESYELADTEYLAALALAPNDPDTLRRLGQLWQTRGDSSRAFEYFEKSLAADPDNLASLYALGRTAAISGENTDRGVECLKSYLEGQPGVDLPAHTHAHWRLGMLYEHEGDTAQARRAYEAALELDPHNEKARKALRKLS